jgi:hypothetical protein
MSSIISEYFILSPQLYFMQYAQKLQAFSFTITLLLPLLIC